MLESITPTNPSHLAETRSLFEEYAAGLGIDICFQNLDQELLELPGDYRKPGGAPLMALYDSHVAGCCALRPLKALNHNNAAEMKRLYVSPDFRGKGIARHLVMEILRKASAMGYSSVVLDTLKSMEEAQTHYKQIGFVEIPAYYDNPIEGAKCLKLDLLNAAALPK